MVISVFFAFCLISVFIWCAEQAKHKKTLKSYLYWLWLSIIYLLILNAKVTCPGFEYQSESKCSKHWKHLQVTNFFLNIATVMLADGPRMVSCFVDGKVLHQWAMNYCAFPSVHVHAYMWYAAISLFEPICYYAWVYLQWILYFKITHGTLKIHLIWR